MGGFFMAGTLFGLPLSIQSDASGPMSGCKLYIYAAETTTLSSIFDDFALTTQRSNPLIGDSSGRIPQFWLADGSYRARLLKSDDTEVFDVDSMKALGPSFGDASTGDVIDATSVASVGDFKWRPSTGTITGWVRANGRTIGSASSAATERASADTEDLFTFFYNNFVDGVCAVSGGRGASAAADYAANKTIVTLDMRGRGAFGVDDMGNAAASILTVGTPTTGGNPIGAEKTTILLANLPSTNLSLASVTVTSTVASVVTGGSTGSDNTHTGAGNFVQSLSSSALAFAVGGTLPLGGSGTPATTVSPGRVGTWYVKL